MLTRHSSGTRNFRCSLCDYTAFTKNAIHKHMAGKHKIGAKTYQCQICGKVVYAKVHYQRHLLTHSNFKPYKCRLCSASYKDNTNYKIHMKNIHGVTIKNPIIDGTGKYNRATGAVGDMNAQPYTT